jgi:hypothetical protein
VKRNEVVTVSLFSLLGILLLLYFFLTSKGDKHYQWFETYKAESDQPYGTLFIKKLLEGYTPKGHFIFNTKKSVYEVLNEKGVESNTDYVLIGQSIYLDYRDTDALLEFVKNGNNAFIATLELPQYILYRFYENECNDNSISYQEYSDKNVSLNFFHDTLKTSRDYTFAYRYGSFDRPYQWNSLDPAVLCEESTSLVPLGYQSPNRINFFKIPYGKGNFYLHANPIVFTNYFMTKGDKVDYASAVFSHLNAKNIVWDEYSKVPIMNNKNGYDSPLYYILQQPSLKYAWWLLLITVFLYILFAAKRTQRVIPVLEEKANTSLEFVNLISALHFKNGNNLDMARKKMRYFFYFIRSKYGIHTQSFTDSEINRLAEKAKVSSSVIKLIFDRYDRIERDAYYNAEAIKLIDLFNAIENFYKQCK